MSDQKEGMSQERLAEIEQLFLVAAAKVGDLAAEVRRLQEALAYEQSEAAIQAKWRIAESWWAGQLAAWKEIDRLRQELAEANKRIDDRNTELIEAYAKLNALRLFVREMGLEQAFNDSGPVQEQESGQEVALELDFVN